MFQLLCRILVAPIESETGSCRSFNRWLWCYFFSWWQCIFSYYACYSATTKTALFRIDRIYQLKKYFFKIFDFQTIYSTLTTINGFIRIQFGWWNWNCFFFLDVFNVRFWRHFLYGFHILLSSFQRTQQIVIAAEWSNNWTDFFRWFCCCSCGRLIVIFNYTLIAINVFAILINFVLVFLQIEKKS